jgi:Kef-type K+ transport system membrane component KefB
VLLGLVILFKKLGIGSLVAFLLAGIMAGPHVLGMFQTSGIWTLLGEVGEMFLWFMLGLELNIKRLWSMRKNIFGFGAIQVLVVACFLFPLISGFTDWTTMGTIMVCLMLAMSSTSTDLQTLADRNELQSGLGRQTFSIILFQDLLSIPLLAMLPVFAGKTLNLGGSIIDVSVMTIGLILGVAIVAKLVMNPVMRNVAKLKSSEAFLLAVVLGIISMSALFHYIGMPTAVGAFLAGMLFSETVYNHQVRADIAPYQMMLMGLFCIVMGMGLNLPYLGHNWWIVLIGSISLMVFKFFAIYMVARVRKVMSRDAFLTALILSQGGEFGLLIMQTIKNANIDAIPIQHTDILTAIIVISMMLTPLLLLIYDKMNENGLLYSHRKAERVNNGEKVGSPSVIICGFGRVGVTIAKMMRAQNIQYIAIEQNVDRVVAGRDSGFNVFYGDTTRGDVLVEFGLAPRKTKALIIALDNAAVAKKTVRAAHSITPRVKIFARARNLQESKILMTEGANIALPETIESSFLLGQGILSNLGVPEQQIKVLFSRMRQNNYETIEELLQK